jgi:uncharacterized membrane protein (UPF0182 family)
MLFSIFTGIYTDLLWFDSVGFGSVFTKQLTTRLLLFVVFGLVVSGSVAANFVIAYRTRPAYQGMLPGQQELDRYRMALDPYRRLVVLGLVSMLGLITGSTAASEWRTYLQWRHGEPFNVRDPQFGRDVSFFAFDLPWWRFVLAFAFATVILSLIAATLTHYLYGGLRLQATLGERATPAARVHLSVLLGTFVLLKAVAYWLDRYGLAVKEDRISKSEFTGLTYTDVNAVLPGRSILALISLICAALFFANVVRRTWLLPGLGVGLLLLSAVLVGGVYPRVVQQFQVRPSEPDKEAPYIERNIAATRTAYGIGKEKVKVQDYNAKTESSPGQLRADSDTTASARLLDPAVLSPTYKNLQQIKGYYDFQETLDVDRYTIDGERRDVVTAVRELQLGGIEERQRNWINDHTVYTHGFGFVAALGNQVTGGRPTFVSSDIPPKGKLGEFEPRIYFGEESPLYSVVGGQPDGKPLELDFPDDAEETTGGARNTTYQGKGGVAIGSFWRQLLYATKYQDANLLLSGRVNSESKILDIRTPKQRLERVAPWLSLDGDPYPAVVDGRIKWIVDGYTTTNGYPYATRSTLEDVTETSQTTTANALVAPVQRVNYIRNSVKATVDAFDGTVDLFAWDENDPVLKTWRKAFPGSVQDRSEISDDLMEHLRYPEDLFKVQRNLLARYHVEGAQGFYNGGDFWRVPVDPTDPNKGNQPPYYLTLKMPGQSEPAFSLTSTYVPIGRRENLTAFMAVNADPGPDYGTFRVLQLPRSVQINGPSQVQNEFSANSDVAELINILARGDSKVVYGNLLTLPVGGGLLYVEPVYVQASTETAFPILEKVLVSFGDKIGFEDTLQAALDAVFAGESGVSTGEEPAETPPPGASPSPSPSPTGTASPSPSPTTSAGGSEALSRALADAEKALADSQAALAEGDFAAYGAAQERLEDAIRRAVAAQPPGGAATSRSSPSPSPSP